MTKEEKLKFLNEVNQKGIDFVMHEMLGYYNENPKNILLFLEDEDQYYANRYEISKEKYIKWQQNCNEEKYNQIFTCSAITKKGKPCKHQIIIDAPDYMDFISEPHYYFKLKDKKFYCCIHYKENNNE